MGRLIDADALLQWLRKAAVYTDRIYCSNVIYMVEKSPTVDSEPVRHEKWIDGGPTEWKCSGCGYFVKRYNNTPYCPNCGSKMDIE